MRFGSKLRNELQIIVLQNAQKYFSIEMAEKENSQFRTLRTDILNNIVGTQFSKGKFVFVFSNNYSPVLAGLYNQLISIFRY